jgi:hypothetical protein
VTEEIRFDIVSVSHSKGLSDAAKDIKALKGETDKLGDSFDDASVDALDFGEQVEATRTQAAKLRTEMGRVPVMPGLRDTTSDAKALNAEIARTESRVKELGVALARTDDRSLFKDLRSERSALAQLLKVRKEMGGGGEDGGRSASAVSSAGAGVASKGGAGLLSMLPRAATRPEVLAGAAALAVPIGAMISGAVVGAVGIGGIAGGIAAASRDGGVRMEAARLAETISGHFFGSGGAMVEPLKRTMQTLGADFKALDLAGLFSKGAPAVEILGRGVGSLAKNLMPGLNAVMDRSVPIAQALADGFSDVGDAFSDALTNMAGSEGTIDGLRDGLGLLADATRTTGEGLTWLSDAYHDLSTGDVFAEIWREATGTDVPAHMRAIGDAAQGAKSAVGALTAGMDAQGRSILTTLDAWKGYVNQLLAVDNATLQFKLGMYDLRDALRESRGKIDDSSEASLRAQQAFLTQVGAAERLRQEIVDQTGDVDRANRTYQEMINKLYAAAQQAGVTKAQLDRLIGDYNITITTRTRVIGGTEGGTRGAKYLSSYGSEFGRAAGGPVQAGHAYLVGEEGPEPFIPSTNGYILPNSSLGGRTAGGVSAGAAMGSAGGWQTARPLRLSGSGLGQLVFDWLREEISARGGTIAVLGMRS